MRPSRRSFSGWPLLGRSARAGSLFVVQYAFERISKEHDVSFFDCGVESLDDWLAKEAVNASNGGLSATWVSVDPSDDYKSVMGYFTLCPTTVHEVGGGSREDGYPGYLLCKIARHLDCQGTAHGELLLTAAMAKTLEAADATGGRFLVVDPMVTGDVVKDDKLRTFYSESGFTTVDGTDRMSMQISTIRRVLKSAS